MDTLKRVLAVMVTILVVVVGAGLYYATRHTGHDIMPNMPNTQQPTAQAPDNKQAKQKVTVVLEPDLRNYINEVNKGISLINEANGLITADPFFADPPVVPKGKLETTPFDKQVPKDRDKPILLLPDGTYQVVADSGSDMRDIHRGIYKLGQGMTVLNSVLDKMNEDIRNNNFPVRTSASANQSGTVLNTGNSMTGMTTPQGTAAIPGTTAAQGTVDMTGMTHGTAGLNLGALNATNIMYLFLVIFLLMAIVSVIGFVVSLFRPKPGTPE